MAFRIWSASIGDQVKKDRLDTKPGSAATLSCIPRHDPLCDASSHRCILDKARKLARDSSGKIDAFSLTCSYCLIPITLACHEAGADAVRMIP